MIGSQIPSAKGEIGQGLFQIDEDAEDETDSRVDGGKKGDSNLQRDSVVTQSE